MFGKNQPFFGTSAGSPEGFATGSECPSVSASPESCGFQGVLVFLTGQSHPGSLMKSSRDTSGCIWGCTLPWASSQVFRLIHSCLHDKIISSSLLPPCLSQAIPRISIIVFFSPNLFPPGTRQGVFDSTLSLSCICQCLKLWFNRSHITGLKLALSGPFHGEHVFCLSLSLLSKKN